MTTPHQSNYWAWCLEARAPSGSVDGLARSLANARLDLNPHQVDAALFALGTTNQHGVLLADEVGLGKTVEAGLVIAQRWAEQRRRILVVVPATLRAQWAAELESKFFLPSRILDGPRYNKARQLDMGSPFDGGREVVIASYAFVAKHAEEVARVPWDLAVIDEAHRLRNVWRTSARTARALHRALHASAKLLLTATPLQNNLMELFGLVGFIDDHVFGDEASFRELFLRNPDEIERNARLAERIAPLCQRTLRRQVQEYVKFTARVPLTFEFEPFPGERLLYDAMTAYLARPRLHALPSGQRHLMTLVLRKLLASSSAAIGPTLTRLAERLEQRLPPDEDDFADFEELDELADEWDEADDARDDAERGGLSGDTSPWLELVDADDAATRLEIEEEVAELRHLADLATRQTVNAKARMLLAALETGLGYAAELGAARKAVIFTESRRTQAMLFDLLEAEGYADRVVMLNGSNNDMRSAELLAAYRVRHAEDGLLTGSRAVDTKAAVVEAFAADYDILLATEAAAEGVNLQFCSLLVNYDLPWNPQRVEQRIGRCHRYGQRHDVVVVNLVDQGNAADQRVLQLLASKLRLFEGLFGASDEVLGAIGNGVDFERQIAAIYQRCRSEEEIHAAFDALQSNLDEQIRDRMLQTRQAVLEHFDADVQARLQIHHDKAIEALDWRERLLLALLRFELGRAASFDTESPRFRFEGTSDSDPTWRGSWNLDWRDAEARREHFLRPDHPFARWAIERALQRQPTPALLEFDYSGSPAKVSALEPLVGSGGWLVAALVHIEARSQEDHVVLVAASDTGQFLDQRSCEHLLGLHAHVAGDVDGDAISLAAETAMEAATAEVEFTVRQRNGRMLDAEIDKLERWADDLKSGIERQLREIDGAIAEARKRGRAALTLAEKLEVQKEIQALEQKRTTKRRRIFDEQDAIDAQRTELIEALEAQIEIRIERQTLFAVRWKLG